VHSKHVARNTVCFKAVSSHCDSFTLFAADVLKSFRTSGPWDCTDECFIYATREAIGRCPEDSWISLNSTAEISPLTFTVHRNSRLCPQASQNSLLFQWRQISYTASNRSLLEGDTYLRSACGSWSNGEARMLCVKSVYLSRNFAELCSSLEISFIHSISEFGLLAIVAAFRDTFIFISNGVHRSSERMLRRCHMFVHVLERTR
jgi:hypothetical protein